MNRQFSIARLPRIEFAAGSFQCLPELIEQYGKHVLLVLGSGRFKQTGHWVWLQQALTDKGIHSETCCVSGEPSPHWVDEQVTGLRQLQIDVVVGIGGGSPLDAAKAIAGLLRIENSVMDFLEGVGPELNYPGPAVPFIAVPTTAGTGSEATKNAVLGIQGQEGFKKSFRDDALVAEYAVLDPALLASCPPALIAANGMDALTQLMESYVSTRANRFCDALAVDAIRAASESLLPWYNHADDTQANAGYREQMLWAALVSGINLAQTGLGSVHGLASPLGAFFPVPHGVVCGTLLAECTRVNITAMREREPDNPALARYAELAGMICGRRFQNPADAWQLLVDTLAAWTQHMQLPRLGEYGLDGPGIDQVVQHARGSSMQTNPIVLSDEEIAGILKARL
ncbi:iron-containing alcohol dehydrogenase [Sulfuriflexus sp.]|uniref:iron-containing alcohol dehydrogenase n=1 Tax=Sulfuriflexus sp. TaxID=2015443 RepID=UPI0028CF40E7|nr:iron-containing alcohol dehydrogenase [Sulfuriflexus sp.]MDT8404303.1 iron-containing alcohol dehydrogenase [Sulfuriflexus sp.]